ncbi:MAG: UDP-N-acetylenolpyruvoylglucosamine reductase [Desulfotalea sp.]|nr:MAG: UDP-N-acetylenolpyruvoylglucosamine reductase [Desulfotalea sp.]
MSTLKKTITLLKSKKISNVVCGEILSKHSAWEIGGPADIFVTPIGSHELSSILKIAKAQSLPVVVIGSGSNLLFDDSGVRGIVIKIDTSFSSVEIENNRILAGAGAWVPCLARAVAKAGLTGLEHIVGIPGTFGGLIYMNGGSLRKNIGESVREVYVMDREGTQHKISREECQFTYRHSLFQQTDYIILGAELECQAGESLAIRQEMLGILRSRSIKFPRKMPNCGSVFVSDPAMYDSYGAPGKIIEECMLKGFSVGGAEVSRHHANFIVNTGKATSVQVMKLINMIRRAVYVRTNYWLRCEVRFVTSSGIISPLHEFL